MESAEPNLIPDQPISSPDEDHLARGAFASALARQLNAYTDERCLVVAFYAPWGTGKSSLLNLLATELAKEREASTPAPVVIRFNPWNFSTLDSLLKMFFRELQAGAGSTGSRWAKPVQESLQTLSCMIAIGQVFPGTNPYFGLASRFFRQGAKALDKSAVSLIAVKDRINTDLCQLNRRIFVLIDDIDRLDQESMRLMFRLIRLNADFSRMTYVLAFDRDVVASALAQEQGASGNEYLEKIVQVGFDIPPAEPAKLQVLFTRSLDKLGIFTNLSEEDLIRWIDFKLGGLDKLLRTPRDVVRYVNGLAVHGGIASSEVNPVDLAAIEAIRTFAPELYSFIRDNSDVMIGQTGGTWNLDTSTTREQLRGRLEGAYSRYKPDLQTPIREVCSQLFPEIERMYGGSTYGGGHYEMWRKSRRICTVDYFSRYFYLRPPEGDVTQSEFDAVVRDAENLARLTARLLQLVDFGKIDNFVVRLADAVPEIREEHIEVIVLALFEIGDRLKRGFWSEDQLLSTAHVIQGLLTRLTASKRASILLEAAETAASLGAVVHFTRLGIEHSQPERAILDEAAWNDVRNGLVARISDSAKDMTLAHSPHLDILLYRWREWAPIEDSQRFVESLVGSDDGTLAFLQGMIAQQASTAGRFTSRRGWYFPIEGAREFIDPELLDEPVQRLKVERWADLTHLQQQAIDAFLAARAKPQGNFFTP